MPRAHVDNFRACRAKLGRVMDQAAFEALVERLIAREPVPPEEVLVAALAHAVDVLESVHGPDFIRELARAA